MYTLLPKQKQRKKNFALTVMTVHLLSRNIKPNMIDSKNDDQKQIRYFIYTNSEKKKVKI